MDPREPAAVLIRKLESIADLTDEVREALRGLPMQVRSIGADQDIVQDGSRPSQCCLLLEGFACRYKLTPDGKRQILSFHIPGDIPDLQSLHLKVMDHGLGTLTPSKVAFIAHDKLLEVCDRHAGLTTAFWRDTLIDSAIFREWIVNVGRRPAYQRMAHVFCELMLRFRAIGIADGDRFELPLTQAELADALGLSTVHVNRTLQELRVAGLITMTDGVVTVGNWEHLKEAGAFDPTYLHVKRAA